MNIKDRARTEFWPHGCDIVVSEKISGCIRNLEKFENPENEYYEYAAYNGRLFSD